MRLHFRDSMMQEVDDVCCDGKPVDRVLEFDTDEGWVEAHLCDDSGKVRPNAAADAALTHRLHGTMTYTTKQVA